MKYIKIARDFTETPGLRTREQSGDKSGQAFRDEILVPAFNEAYDNKDKITIDFDGGYGYNPSFLEEAFGGLVRLQESNTKRETILDTFEFISNDDPLVIEMVESYIRKAISC